MTKFTFALCALHVCIHEELWSMVTNVPGWSRCIVYVCVDESISGISHGKLSRGKVLYSGGWWIKRKKTQNSKSRCRFYALPRRIGNGKNKSHKNWINIFMVYISGKMATLTHKLCIKYLFKKKMLYARRPFTYLDVLNMKANTFAVECFFSSLFRTQFFRTTESGGQIAIKTMKCIFDAECLWVDKDRIGKTKEAPNGIITAWSFHFKRFSKYYH